MSMIEGVARVAADRGSQSLVAGLRAQDPAVAAPLWQRFAPLVFRLLQHTLGPDAAVDDAVHVVMLCVFHRGRRLRPRADLRKLVLETTARVAQGERRRRTISWLAAVGRVAGLRAPRSRTTRGDESVRRFYRVLDRLNAPERIAFVFHHIERLDIREVAAATGASLERTARRLQRSLIKVAEWIEDDPVLRHSARPGNA
jgi:RNA polymerase sigma factor (sigma-70 family)